MPRIKAFLAIALLAGSGVAAAVEAPFVWTVQGPKTQHLLMGSVHVLPSTAYPLPAGFDRAYQRSEGLVLETDAAALQEADFQGRMMSAAIAPQGLKGAIRPKLYADLRKRAQELELPMSLCDPFKAWFCALSLELFSLQAQGISGEYGLDQHFFERARRDDKPVRWLEEPAQQLAIFAQMTEGLSEQFLASTLKSFSMPGRDPADVVRQWQDNDVAGLHRLVVEMKRDFPDAYDRLLVTRNRAWLSKLTAIFNEDRPQLVIVGAAHLVGDDGLPEMLRAQGWKLQPAATGG